MDHVMTVISEKFKLEVHQYLFQNPRILKVFLQNKCEDVLLKFLQKISKDGKIDELFAS